MHLWFRKFGVLAEHGRLESKKKSMQSLAHFLKWKKYKVCYAWKTMLKPYGRYLNDGIIRAVFAGIAAIKCIICFIPVAVQSTKYVSLASYSCLRRVRNLINKQSSARFRETEHSLDCAQRLVSLALSNFSTHALSRRTRFLQKSVDSCVDYSRETRAASCACRFIVS